MLKTIQDEFNRAAGLLKYTSLRAIGQAFGMLVPLVVAKFFASDVFGSFSLARMIIFFFINLLIAAGQVPFVVYAAKEKTQTGKVNHSFSIQLLFFVLSLFLFTVPVFFFGQAVTNFAGISRAELAFLGLAYVGICIQSFLSNFFLAVGQRTVSSLTELLFGFFNLVFLSVFYAAGAMTLNSVFLIYFLSSLPVILLWLIYADFKQILPLTFDRSLFNEILPFTLWTSVGGVAFFLVSWGDNLVIKYYMSMSDIGDYNFAYLFFKVASSIAFFLSPYFLPFISQHIEDPVKMREYFSAKRIKILLLGVTLIAVAIVITPQILTFFYGDKYISTVPVIRVLLVASVIVLYSTFYIPIFNALKEYKILQTTTIIQVVINLGLDIILIPRMGILGAAISTVVGYFCCACLYEVYYRVKLIKILNL